jgi:hypothetical protein
MFFTDQVENKWVSMDRRRCGEEEGTFLKN